MSADKMREEFEAKVMQEWPYPNLNRCDVSGSNRENEYVDTCVEYAWWGWRNSRAAISIDLPCGGYFAGYDNEHMMESRDVRDAIEEAGLKVKK